MQALRFAAGLILALFVHFFLVALAPGVAEVVDPLLLLIVFQALNGNVLGAVLAGCIVGLTQDAFSNGLFGIYGLAGTVVGFVAARSALFLSLERRRFVALLFGLSAVLQQVVVLLLFVLLVVDRELPTAGVLSLRIVLAGVLGSLLVSAVGKVDAWLRAWRLSRRPRVRWGIRE